MSGFSQKYIDKLTFIDWTRLDVPASGLAAVVRLSNGDMRKALNILQVMIST